MGRATILSKISTFILTGGRRTTASGTRDVLTEMANTYVACIYDTATNFTTSNPILETKQHGVETDGLTTAPKFKIGDGVTAWNSLPYAGGSSLGYTPEDAANKSTSVNTDQASNTKYPSVKAVYDWATGLFVKKGTLTTNYIPKATASDTIGDSALYENGSGFGVNYGGQDVFYGDATESFMGLSTNEFIDVIAARTEIKHSVEIKLNAPVVNATNLTASQRVETDSNKNFVSVAKGTADNKDFGTGTANIVEIGSTLGNSKPLITSSSGKLQTSDWVDITSSCTYVGWSSYTNQDVEYLDMGSYYLIRLSVSGTSNNTITTIQIPFTINYGFNSVNIFTNNGSSLGGRVVISAASDTFTFSSSVTGGTWTAAGTKTINCTLTIKK